MLCWPPKRQCSTFLHVSTTPSSSSASSLRPLTVPIISTSVSPKIIHNTLTEQRDKRPKDLYICCISHIVMVNALLIPSCNKESGNRSHIGALGRWLVAFTPSKSNIGNSRRCLELRFGPEGLNLLQRGEPRQEAVQCKKVG